MNINRNMATVLILVGFIATIFGFSLGLDSQESEIEALEATNQDLIYENQMLETICKTQKNTIEVLEKCIDEELAEEDLIDEAKSIHKLGGLLLDQVEGIDGLYDEVGKLREDVTVLYRLYDTK